MSGKGNSEQKVEWPTQALFTGRVRETGLDPKSSRRGTPPSHVWGQGLGSWKGVREGGRAGDMATVSPAWETWGWLRGRDSRGGPQGLEMVWMEEVDAHTQGSVALGTVEALAPQHNIGWGGEEATGTPQGSGHDNNS